MGKILLCYSGDKNNIYNVIGSRLGTISKYFDLDKVVSAERDKFLTENVGVNYTTLSNEYKNLVRGINSSIDMATLISSKAQTNLNLDLNEGLLNLENVKNII